MDKLEQLKFRSKTWQFPLLVFLVTWIFLWGWMWLIQRIYPTDISPDAVLRPYMGVTPETNSWLEVWQRWDVLHYQAIAERGYQAFETALFTPPLYPILIRLVSLTLYDNTLLAGLIVSALFCAASFITFHRLAQFELGSRQLADRTVFYFAIFPTSFFLFAPYTESLFMLGAVSCLLALRQNKWLAAGAWGMLAASSRLTGMVMLLPITWAAWGHWKRTREWKAWLAPSLTLFAAILFPLYTWLGLGKSIFAPFEAQSARFHGGFTIPGLNMLAALRQIFLNRYAFTNFWDLVFMLIFLGCGFLVWKQLPRLYGIYYFAFVVIYLMRIADIYPLLSMMRYVLALFPAFLVLARYGQNPITHRVISFTFLLGLLFFSAQFAIWGWVG
jgi:hypothetical protein